MFRDTLYEEIIMSADPRKIGGAAEMQVEMDSEELKRKLDEVDKWVTPMSIPPDVAENLKKQRKNALRAAARKAGGRAACLAAAPVAGEDAAGQAAAGAPFLPLKQQLDNEVKIFAEIVRETYWEAQKKGFVSIYGDPMEEGTKERYRFWPARKINLQLLYYCAERLLGTGAASTCFLERRHSTAGYIMSKRRARLKSSTAENLTLAYFMLRDKAQTEAACMEFTDALAEETEEEE